MRRRRGRIARRAGLYAILGFFVFFSAFPFYWMVIATFKRDHDLFSPLNNPFLFNEPPTMDHLRLLFLQTNYATYLVNTALVGLAVVAITLPPPCPPPTPWRAGPGDGGRRWGSGSS